MTSYYFSFRALLKSAIYCAVCILVKGLKLPPFWITKLSCSSPWTKILSLKTPSKIDDVLMTPFVALLVNSVIPPEEISSGLLINSYFFVQGISAICLRRNCTCGEGQERKFQHFHFFSKFMESFSDHGIATHPTSRIWRTGWNSLPFSLL